MRRGTLAQDLWAYGEEASAEAVFRLPLADFERICARTYEVWSDFPEAAGHGMMLAKACALAAVEVIDGTPRPLARQRRRKVPLPPQLVEWAAQEEAYYEVPFAQRQPKLWPGTAA
jgi:hypothetical protein